MTAETQIIPIKLLDKTLHIRCLTEQTAELQKCAQILDEKMRELTHQTNKNHDQITILASLSVIYDLINELNKKELYIESLSSHIRELQNKIHSANN